MIQYTALRKRSCNLIYLTTEYWVLKRVNLFCRLLTFLFGLLHYSQQQLLLSSNSYVNDDSELNYYTTYLDDVTKSKFLSDIGLVYKFSGFIALEYVFLGDRFLYLFATRMPVLYLCSNDLRSIILN